MTSLYLQPITLQEANAYIEKHHRHSLPPQGWKFGVAVGDGEKVRGVVTIGRPVARLLDDGFTLEVTRCCTDGTNNVASMLYGAAWRASKALGYRKLITYTLPSEGGSSLRAAGYRVICEHAGNSSWKRPNRIRVDTVPVQTRIRWERCVSV